MKSNRPVAGEREASKDRNVERSVSLFRRF